MHELLVEGGGERQCLCLARELVAQGHEVTVYASVHDSLNCFPQLLPGIDIQVIGRGAFPWLRRPLFLRGYLDMKKLAAAIKVKHDVWNPHHWPAQWGATWLKRKLGGAVVWMSNDVPNLHERAHQQHPIRNPLRALVYRLFYLYDRAQNQKIDITVLVSDWAQTEYQRIYPGRTCVVHPGMDPREFRPGGDRKKIRDRFGYAPDEFVVLWLGIIMPHRRLQDAIEAIAELRKRELKVRLLIAGSVDAFPGYVSSLQAQTARLHLEKSVTFSGRVANHEMRDFYCACDAFVFPNENQTWGLAVLEAMSCGCPVMVSSGAAVHEALVDQENGLIFPARTPKALAVRIANLISDQSFRQRIAVHGMDSVRSSYSWAQYARNVLAVFRQATSSQNVDLKVSKHLIADL